MGAPIPAPAPAGVVVTLDTIYAMVQATHEAVQPLIQLPDRVDAQEKRIRSLENWRLALIALAMASSGTAMASLFQLPVLNK